MGVIGIAASNLLVFEIPIVLAGTLGGRRFLFTIAGGSCGVVLLVLLFLDTTALPGATALVTNTISVGYFLVVTGIVTWFLARFGTALRQALITAQSQEQDLRQIRDTLEHTVAERTSALQAALTEVQARAAEQARLLSAVDQYQVTIRDMTMPVIPINRTTLVMPLIGALDTARLNQLHTQALTAVERAGARTLLIDVTGVSMVDTHVAQGLIGVTRAVRLLGAHVVLTGIRPEVAQTIVTLGISFQDLVTRSTLEAGMTYVLQNPNGTVGQPEIDRPTKDGRSP